MNTVSTPREPHSSCADDDTLRLPLATAPTRRHHRADDHATRQPGGPVLDVTQLWAGGLATAAVEALVGLVGTLVIRVLFEYAPVGVVTTRASGTGNAAMLCLFAAVSALAATGVAHPLMVSTPEPLSYLGRIIGLSTAVAVVLPLPNGLPLAAAVAIAVVNLVIGLAIGSLMIDTAMTTRRYATR